MNRLSLFKESCSLLPPFGRVGVGIRVGVVFGYYFTYSAKSVRCMSPLRASVSCIAKAAGR